MDLKSEFLAALRGGVGHDSLLELVHRFERKGMAPRAAYETLEQIWLDFGFNGSDEESELRDNLEYVMERIWYECPASPK